MVAKKKTSTAKKTSTPKRTIKRPKSSAPRMSKVTGTPASPARKAPKRTGSKKRTTSKK